MSEIAFDTLAYAKKLKQAGVPEEQAEVHAEALAQLVEERLATKQDLRQMEERLSHRMQELEYKITFRLGSMMVVAIGIVATLVKLL